jgi:uncharacterized protein with HEPN domain
MTASTRDHVYIIHMLECIDRIDSYVSNDKERFFKDLMLQDATLRVLQVMAESSQRLSDEAKKA